MRQRKTLNKTYETLFNRLSDLENTALEKIKELSIASDFFDIKNSDLSDLKDKVIEQVKSIEDLEKQLEKAHEKIEELKKENEFLNEKNSLHVDKIFKFKSQGSKLIDSVEEQLEKIREVTKSKAAK